MVLVALTLPGSHCLACLIKAKFQSKCRTVCIYLDCQVEQASLELAGKVKTKSKSQKPKLKEIWLVSLGEWVDEEWYAMINTCTVHLYI